MAILSSELNIVRIKMEILSLYSGVVCNEEEICFVNLYDEQYHKDLIIVDHNYLKEFWQNSVVTSSKFLLYINGFIFDPYDKPLIKELEKTLIENKQWNTLRTINKVKRHLNVLHKKLIFDSKPSILQLEMTNFCNAKCIMCPHIYQENIGARHLSGGTFGKIEGLLPYVEVAILHGNGEPFMNPNFERFLEIYRKYDIAISACTNLSIFNTRIAKIVDDCFEDIRVSCDACTKDKYERIRTGLSFDKLLRNLEILNTYCNKVNKIMTFVIMRQNIPEISLMVDFAAKYGFKEVIYSNMLPSIALGNEKDAPNYYKETVKYQLDIAKEKAKEKGIRIIYPHIYDEIIGNNDAVVDDSFRSDDDWKVRVEQIYENFKSERRPIEDLVKHKWKNTPIDCVGICDWLIEKTYIDVDGNVFLCCINSSFRIGNVNEEAFMDIWNSKIMRDVREYFYSGCLPDFCHGCQFILNDSLVNLESNNMKHLLITT